MLKISTIDIDFSYDYKSQTYLISLFYKTKLNLKFIFNVILELFIIDLI